MLQCVFVHSERYGALLTRYFDISIPLQARNQLEALVDCWWKRKRQEIDGSDEVMMCNRSYVLIRFLGELRVALVGTEEYDEFVCTWL